MKTDKESLSIMKQSVNISKGGMEDLAMFTHAMHFFKEHANLKMSIPKHFFTSLLNNLSTKDLLTIGNLLSTEIMNPQQRLYATPSKQACVPQEMEQSLKTTDYLLNDRASHKTTRHVRW
jgi:hypothetical protein